MRQPQKHDDGLDELGRQFIQKLKALVDKDDADNKASETGNLQQVDMSELIAGVLEVVRTEPELPGEPNEETMQAMIDAGPIANARIAVKTTKACIEERLKDYFKRYTKTSDSRGKGE